MNKEYICRECARAYTLTPEQESQRKMCNKVKDICTRCLACHAVCYATWYMRGLFAKRTRAAGAGQQVQ